MTNPSDRIEVITSVQRRRRWAASEKVHMIEETLEPGATVSLVARRLGVAPNQLFTWRRKATALRVNHHGFRDALMISTAFRHGLRVAELVELTWDQVDFDAGKLHVRRGKNSSPSTHMLQGDELRMLRRLKREQQTPSPFVFTSERGSPFTTAGFRKMLARLGVAAGIGFPIHPTCSATAPASSSPMTASTPGPSRTIWGTSRSPTPFVIPG